IQRLASLSIRAPSQPASISYLTSIDHSGTCDTAVHVETTHSGSQDSLAQFAQSELAPSNPHRLLQLKLTGHDSSVTLSSQGTFGATSVSACQVTLRVGDWQQPMTGFVPIKISVPAGSAYRLRWEAADIKVSGFNTAGPALSLLTFGHARRQ